MAIERAVLTIPEAAEMLGVSRAAAYQLAQKGEIPVVKLGRRRVVPAKQLRDMLGVKDTVTVAPHIIQHLYIWSDGVTTTEPERK